MQNSTLGIIIALISTASWALCAISLKKLGERLDPVGMTTVKSLLSSVLLFIAVILTGTNIFINTNHLLPILLSGIIGIAIGDSLFFASLNRLSPMLLSLILFVGPDIFTGLFGFLFLNECPSVLAWLGILAILGGLGCFIFPLEEQTEDNNAKTTFVGIIFAFLSLVCMAYSFVIIKPVLIEVPTITATAYRMAVSGIMLLITGIITRKFGIWKESLSDNKYKLKLSGTITLATFGGFWLSLLAIKHCDLIIASTIMSLEPVFILLFMVIFNKYKPKCKEYLGLLFVMIGLILILNH